MSLQLQGANALSLALAQAAAWAAGSTAGYIRNVGAIDFCINGVWRTQKGATAAAGVAQVIEPNSGLVPTAPNSFVTLDYLKGESCGFAIFLDTSGVFTVAQGPIAPAGSSVVIPQAPLGKVLCGAFKVSTTTANYVNGTTVAGTGNTTTWFNLSGHPGTVL